MALNPIHPITLSDDGPDSIVVQNSESRPDELIFVASGGMGIYVDRTQLERLRDRLNIALGYDEEEHTYIVKVPLQVYADGPADAVDHVRQVLGNADLGHLVRGDLEVEEQ